MTLEDFVVRVATEEDVPFAQAICDEMAESAKATVDYFAPHIA